MLFNLSSVQFLKKLSYVLLTSCTALAFILTLGTEASDVNASDRLYSKEQRLFADDRPMYGLFGSEVALSGTTLMSAGNDKVFVFERVNGSWVQQQTLANPDQSQQYLGSNFGSGIDLEGDTAVISTYYGAAYVFTRQNGLWTQQQKLVPNDFPNGDNGFGNAVALDGDVVLIGAAGDSTAKGAAYIFVRQNGIWTQQQKLTASVRRNNAYFGQAVALQNGIALIGTPYTNTSYVFTLANGNGIWSEQQILSVNNPGSSGYFGFSLDIDGDWAIIGQSDDAAYIFHRQGGVWSQTQTLEGHIGNEGNFDTFGWAVALQGDVAVVGARRDSDLRGIGFVYRLVNNQWISQRDLTPSMCLSQYGFPQSLAMDGDYIAYGAPFDDVHRGAVYVFASIDILPSDLQVPTDEVCYQSTITMTHTGSPSPATDTPVAPTATPITPTETPVTPTVTPTDTLPAPTATSLPPNSTNTPTPIDSNPTSTPSRTQAPENTLTPSVPPPTVTLTATRVPNSLDLVYNGSFEVDDNGDSVPDGWTAKNRTNDKHKCNNAHSAITFDLRCIYQFKGGAGENSKLQQNVYFEQYDLSVGDTLTLGGYVWVWRNQPSISEVVLKVDYADPNLPTDKLVVTVDNPNIGFWYSFDHYERDLTIRLPATPSTIKLQIKHTATSGKVRYDAVNLSWQSGGISEGAFTNSRGETLPLPPAP